MFKIVVAPWLQPGEWYILAYHPKTRYYKEGTVQGYDPMKILDSAVREARTVIDNYAVGQTSIKSDNKTLVVTAKLDEHEVVGGPYVGIVLDDSTTAEQAKDIALTACMDYNLQVARALIGAYSEGDPTKHYFDAKRLQAISAANVGSGAKRTTPMIGHTKDGDENAEAVKWKSRGRDDGITGEPPIPR